MKSIVCDRCGCGIDGNKEDHTYHIGPSWGGGDMVLCDECYDTHYSTCDACGNTVVNTMLNRVYDADTDAQTDECVCSDCEDDGEYYRCGDCGRVMRGEYIHVNAPYAGIVNAICPSCANDGTYIHCDACGHLFEEGYCSYSEYHDAYYCEECTPCDMYCIRSYGDGHPDGLEFFGTPSDGLYFGAEIEMNDGGCYDENAARVLDILGHDHAHCEEDGSIMRGFETITQPMSLSYFHEQFSSKLERAYKEWRKMGYSNGNAGLHVHVSRDPIRGKEEVLWTLIQKFQDELIVFSRRDDTEALEHYAAFPHRIMTWKTRERGNRYQALNLENYNTVEFRFPKGTLFHDEYVATVTFCVGLARWAMRNELDDVASISWYELVSEILDTIEIGAIRETLLIYLCRYGLYWENDMLRVRLGDVFQDIATGEIPRLEQASAAD